MNRNLSGEDWAEATIFLEWRFMGYKLKSSRIEKGGSATYNLNQFVSSGGKLFNPVERSPKEIVVSVEGYSSPVLNW